MIFPTTFYGPDGEYLFDEVYEALALSIGDGVLAPDSTRYRVVDRWLSLDKLGRFGPGFHVFLASVDGRGEDDRLYRLAPDYFTAS